ncbi:copper amine oxidase N-terminal domain-containing protein [Paenibacillus sp. y28]|uniref:copper amine oxidase N-terminal domain-containing protein n=1 Tax=Paenibacillus sp. y28 TaxID=3129110 RepID=UPI003018ACA5
MRRWKIGFLCVTGGLLLFGSGVLAGTSGAFIEVYYSVRGIEAKGKKLDLSDKPFIYNGTVYAPVRSVAEHLGQKVVWDEAYRTVELHCGDGIQPYRNSREICIRDRNVILPEDVFVMGEAIEGAWPISLVLNRGEEFIAIQPQSGVVFHASEHGKEAFEFLLPYITAYFIDQVWSVE